MSKQSIAIRTAYALATVAVIAMAVPADARIAGNRISGNRLASNGGAEKASFEAIKTSVKTVVLPDGTQFHVR
jgi:hypothetical protein